MEIVHLRGVSRSYQSGDHVLKALDGVDLSLEAGKFVVILGPSGAGKSTLLNLLGGLDSPTEGTITVKGRDISRLSRDQLADYRAETVGFVFQFYYPDRAGKCGAGEGDCPQGAARGAASSGGGPLRP